MSFKNKIVSQKPTWPPFTKNGLNMRIISENTKDNSNQAVEFAFEHAKEYQTIQFLFLDAVESLDHNNIIVNKTFSLVYLTSLINKHF